MPIDWTAPLPKTDNGFIEVARATGACPIATIDWYRLPQMFDIALKLCGPATYNRLSRTRLELDKTLSFACSVWKNKYMAPCERRHQETCCRLLEQAFQNATQAHPEKPLPYLRACIKGMINHEQADESLKPLVPKTKLTFDSCFQPA